MVKIQSVPFVDFIVVFGIVVHLKVTTQWSWLNCKAPSFTLNTRRQAHGDYVRCHTHTTCTTHTHTHTRLHTLLNCPLWGMIDECSAAAHGQVHRIRVRLLHHKSSPWHRQAFWIGLGLQEGLHGRALKLCVGLQPEIRLVSGVGFALSTGQWFSPALPPAPPIPYSMDSHITTEKSALQWLIYYPKRYLP